MTDFVPCKVCVEFWNFILNTSGGLHHLEMVWWQYWQMVQVQHRQQQIHPWCLCSWGECSQVSLLVIEQKVFIDFLKSSKRMLENVTMQSSSKAVALKCKMKWNLVNERMSVMIIDLGLSHHSPQYFLIIWFYFHCYIWQVSSRPSQVLCAVQYHGSGKRWTGKVLYFGYRLSPYVIVQWLFCTSSSRYAMQRAFFKNTLLRWMCCH